MSDLSVTKRFSIPESELVWSASRSSGPGGQNVNKVNSKVTLRWRPALHPGFDEGWLHRFSTRFSTRISRDGEVILHSDKTRDQFRNLADVRARLVAMLLECRVPPKTRTPTRPTLGSKKRRMEGKRRLADKKRLRGGPQRDD